MFQIKDVDAQRYRSETRRNAFILAGLFFVLGMGLSQGAVALFGTPGGDNFRWILGGVLVAVALMYALVRYRFWAQPWMAMSVYGWQLKRNLMRVTNVMHKVTEGVAKNDVQAMKLLRFYHLGLMQMHELDANSSDLLQARAEIAAHEEHMRSLGLDLEQSRLDPAWLASFKSN